MTHLSIFVVRAWPAFNNPILPTNRASLRNGNFFKFAFHLPSRATGISSLPKFFFISVLSTFVSTTHFTHAYGQCLENQKTLLLELKNDLIFDSSISRKLVQWNRTDDCCSWNGVECDRAGHVIGLQLNDEGISGGLENSSSLFSFRYLEKLSLAGNAFNNSQIPGGIQNLTHLSHLNLSYAEFGGRVPVELSLLRRLVSLDISWNSRTHPLKLEYPNFRILIQNLTGLRELYLDDIDISIHGIELCHVISSSLPDLRNLSLRHCNVSGPLDPSLLQLHSLSILQLDWNDLSTAVLDFFANFSSLTTLSLKNCSLKGTFPEMIFQVPTLQNLDLSYNPLLSGTIPQFPESRSFRSIVLGYTNFSGLLPDSICNLRMLSEIALPGCKFTGSIPSALANLTELVYVDLSSNFFTGLIPPFYLSKKLEYIDLSTNSLTGSLSSTHFQGLSNLFYMDLGYNSLSGSIPQSLFGLTSLRTLVLNNNQFSGTFQLENIQGLRNLQFFDISYNNLSADTSNTNSSLFTFPQLRWLSLASCNLYKFPDFMRQFKYLSNLDLSNNRIAGEIPSWIWATPLLRLNLSCNLLVDLQRPYDIPTSLQILDLHSNQLRGELPLPPEVAFYVDYSNNVFDTIPLDIGNISTSPLIFLLLANNKLSGAIPTSLCNFIYLEVLDLSFNNLSGNIPPCLLENIGTLVVLNLGENSINGDIPDNFSVNCRLQTLDLSDNNLGGKIPRSLANCKSLEVMNVGNNNINDSLPCMLSSSLRVLVLRSNRFYGEVRCHESWPNLQIIDIAANQFSGNLHPIISLSSWRGTVLDSDTQLRHILVGYGYQYLATVYYQDEVKLTIKGLERKLLKIQGYFVSIDLSCNNFEGEIPDAIGDLSSLYLLNFSHNSLTGTIPRSFGKMTQLGSLDLSVNQLTGMVPVELAGLTFLSGLNLSYNKLVGMIPTGPQFRTFSADSFEGNRALCGFPLNISCSSTSDGNDLSPPTPETARAHRKMEIEWDYVCAALGYVVGVGSFGWVLLFCGSLRRIYFEKVDEVLEKIFWHQDRKRRHGRGRVLRNQVRRQ